MNKEKQTGDTSFSIFELVIAIVLLGVLVAAGVYMLDPTELAKKARDERYKEFSATILENLDSFLALRGFVPWDPDQSKDQSIPLNWTSVNDPKIGICADEGCTSSGILGGEGLIGNSLITQDFIKTKDPELQIFVGKGGGDGTSLWACFIPESKSLRVDPIPLKAILPDNPVSGAGEPDKCNIKPDWVNSFCYQCVSRKLSIPQ